MYKNSGSESIKHLMFVSSFRTNFFYDKPLLVRWMKQHEMEEKLDCRLKEEQVSES